MLIPRHCLVRTLASVLLLFAVAAAPCAGSKSGSSAAQDTAMYRANPRQTGYYEAIGPTSAPAVAWETKLPAAAHPLVVGAGLVLCPIVRNLRGPTGLSRGRLYALDADSGTQAWVVPELSGPPSGPAIADGQVFFSAGTTLSSVDPVTGKVGGELKVGDHITTPCTAGGNPLYFGTDGGYVVSVGTDLQNPRQIQLTENDPGSELGDIFAAPAADGGTLYASTTGEYVYAMDLQDGSVLWQQPIEYLYIYMARVNSRVCVTDEHVLYARDLETLVCADRQTGQTQWEFAVTSPFITDFAVDDDMVYVPDTAGGPVYALHLADGTVAWQFEPPSRPGHVSVDQQQVYFGTADGRVYALDKSNGQENWHIDLDVQEGIAAAPVPTSSALFVAGRKGKVFRLE